MTASRVSIVSCDSCGEQFDPPGRTATESRRWAMSAGWTVDIDATGRVRGDLCEACAQPRKLLDVLAPEVSRK